MVGNGVTNWEYDTTPATVDVAYYRSLMSSSTYNSMQKLGCDFSGVAIGNFSNVSAECLGHLSTMYQGMQDIDVYNIYGECWGVNASANASNWTAAARSQLYGKTMINGEEKEYKKFMTAQEYTPWVKRVRRPKGDNQTDYGIPRCIYALPAAEQLNNATVRAQLNVNNSQVWRMCAVAGESTFSYTIGANASQWAYEALKDEPVRMLHYSGDQDASVPTIGTERWINALKWNTTKPWGPFMLADNQVAGYYQKFDGDLSLVTVHGAGHMVPQDQRERAYYILFNWVLQRKEFGHDEEAKPEEEPQPELLQW
jgi:pimeloyl-ACP methyl ester carboxylesterase